MTDLVEVVDLRDEADQATRPVDLERVRGAAAAALAAEGRADAGLSVAVVDDGRIAELHARYLGVEGPTDVIAFPLADEDDEPFPGEAQVLGEVVVSADTAAYEARERGLGFERELLLYVVHGTLHLLGYDDHDPQEKRRMEARQEELLEAFLAS